MMKNENERKRIGIRIAELRAAVGMTQTELAERAGIERCHIVRVEQGRYSVGVDILSAIAAVFGKRVDFM